MAFPNVVYGSPGDQFVTGATQTADVGTGMIFEDGRRFRYVLNGAAAQVAGDIQSPSARITNHIAQTPTAAAIGATAITITTLGATAVTADQYKDGYVAVELGTGFGYTYTISGNVANAGGVAFTVPLRDSVQVAIPATANSVSLISNRSRTTVVAPTTPLNEALGCAMKPVAIAGFGWVQSRGICAATVVAATVIGNNLIVLTTAGSLGPTAVDIQQVVAIAANTVVAATNKGTVFMTCE